MACEITTHIFFSHTSYILIQSALPPEGHFPPTHPERMFRVGRGGEKPLLQYSVGGAGVTEGLEYYIQYLFIKTLQY
jgi:hypothetical protein